MIIYVGFCLSVRLSGFLTFICMKKEAKMSKLLYHHKIMSELL